MSAGFPREPDRIDQIFGMVAAIDKRLAVVEAQLATRLGDGRLSVVQWFVVIGSICLAILLVVLMILMQLAAPG